MNLSPFLDAPLDVQIHVIAAIEALLLGPFVLYRRRRDRWHRMLGYVWVSNLVVAAASSFFILENPMIGPFSPIHVLSVWALWGVWQGVRFARTGNSIAHRAVMTQLFWGAIGIASVLTLLPGRRMNRMIFGAQETLGLWVIGGVAVAVLCWQMWRRERRISSQA